MKKKTKQKTSEPTKDLWCKKCRCYPDKVVEDGGQITRREWDGECYQGYDTEYLGEGDYYCQDCDTKLVIKY